MLSRRKYSLATSQAVILDCAFLSASMLSPGALFRPRDIEFYFDLYANWLEYSRKDVNFGIELIQITRLLAHYQKHRFVEIKKKGMRKYYSLSFEGAFSLLKRLVQPELSLPVEKVLFVRYIVFTYGSFLKELLFSAPIFISSQRKKEILEMLDPNTVVQQQIRSVNLVIADLESRIEESHSMVQFARSELTKSSQATEVAKMLSKKFSYQLAYKKSLTEFYRQLPQQMLDFELSTGIEQRNTEFFEHLLRYHRNIKQQLEQILRIKM